MALSGLGDMAWEAMADRPSTSVGALRWSAVINTFGTITTPSVPSTPSMFDVPSLDTSTASSFSSHQAGGLMTCEVRLQYLPSWDEQSPTVPPPSTLCHSGGGANVRHSAARLRGAEAASPSSPLTPPTL